MSDRRVLLSLTFLIFLAFGLRVGSLDAQSMWRDEIDTFCFALDFWTTLERAVSPASVESPSPPIDRPHCQPTPGLPRVDASQGLWPTLRDLLTMSGWNGPLYTVAMRPWIGLTGYSPFALRFSSLLLGVLAVPLTYVLGRRLLGTLVGLTGAALVALSPHLVWYSQEAKMYSAILALALLAIYALRRALDQTCQVPQSLGWWIVMVGATTLALYCHILTALLIPLHVLLCLIWWPRARRHWRAVLFSLACLTLPYLPLLAWQARQWLRPRGQATLFAARGLDVVFDATFNGWAGHYVGEPWATLLIVSLGGLALCGLGWVWLTGDAACWRPPLALLTWVSWPLLGIWFLSLRQPIFTNRYLIWAAPAFYLAASAGALALARQGRWGILVAGGLLTAVLVGDGFSLWRQATEPLKPDFRAAAAYVGERYQPRDLLIFHLSYVQHNFDFYAQGDYDSWGAPAPGDGMPETELDTIMQVGVNGRRILWLVLSEPGMWDPGGRVKVWLDAHAVGPPQIGLFAHVSVYRYEMSEE